MTSARIVPDATIDHIKAEIAKDLIVVYVTLGDENSNFWERAKTFLLSKRAIELFLLDPTKIDPAPTSILETIGWSGEVKPVGSDPFDADDVGGVFINRTGATAYTLTKQGAKKPSWISKGLKLARKPVPGAGQ